jgi:hypothetical protein
MVFSFLVSNYWRLEVRTMALRRSLTSSRACGRQFLARNPFVTVSVVY